MLTVKLPPTIVRHPAEYTVSKREAELVVLECVAEGSPPLR